MKGKIVGISGLFRIPQMVPTAYSHPSPTRRKAHLEVKH